jgi:hypothetical protein
LESISASASKSDALMTRIIGALATGSLSSIRIATVNTIDNKIAYSENPAPQVIPTAILQNRNIKSIGSLIAVLNLTMDNAPTIPRDTTTLDWIVTIMAVVINATPTKEILKFFE